MKTLNHLLGMLMLSILFYSCDKNEHAPVIVDQNFTLSEDTPEEESFGTVVASDADAGQRLSYEITDGNLENIFRIDGSSGFLFVDDADKLDYESQTHHVLQVVVSDNHKNDPLESSARIYLDVTDANEFAPQLRPELEDEIFEILENSSAGTIIGLVQATDADRDQAVSYSISDGNDLGIFTIDPEKGLITVADGTQLDYESDTTHWIVVTVADNHQDDPLESSAEIQINLRDQNEFAPEMNNQGFTLDENPLNGQEIGLVQATDEDIHQNLTYSIVGSDEQNYVNIDSETGILTVKDSLGFDYESADHMSFMVKVVDDHKNQLADSATVTILIHDVGTKHAIIMQPGPSEGKDAFVEDYAEGNYSNRNFGDLEEFSAISWTSSGLPFLIRSFIEFEFSPIPERAVIDSAKLSLFAHGSVAHGDGHAALDGTNEFYLRRVISAWDEHTITWNSQPETTSLSAKLVPASTDQHQDYTGIDVTALVRDMYENPSESYGFMLSLKTEEGFKRVFFGSSDVPDESRRPKIEIYYSVE